MGQKGLEVTGEQASGQGLNYLNTFTFSLISQKSSVR